MRDEMDQHAVTPSEWDLLMRLDDVLPKGHPDHRLVIEAGMALVVARAEAGGRGGLARLADVRRWVQMNLDAWDDDGTVAAAITRDWLGKVLNMIDTGHPLSAAQLSQAGRKEPK